MPGLGPGKTGDTIAGFLEIPEFLLVLSAIRGIMQNTVRMYQRAIMAIFQVEQVMPQTIGYHLVKSAFGLWLPGDARGHWSTAWDEQIGHYEPHHLHEGDPVRERMARERMKHPPTRFTPVMIDVIADAVGQCACDSDWQIVSAAIEPTHMHLLLTYTERDIDRTAKWLAQQTTKQVHRCTRFAGPVWCEGKWLEFVFDEVHFENIRRYIERHNLRRGRPARPWKWIAQSQAGHTIAHP